jgi:glutamine--fructose-6-phosphate transaminase (EC 2.6.1.16)
LKFKEASLTHAEGIQLGELLHGPIALTNKGYPIVIVKPSKAQADNLYNKVIRSVLDKGSLIITVSPEGDIKSVDTTSSKPNIKCYTTSIYGLQIRSKKEFADR